MRTLLELFTWSAVSLAALSLWDASAAEAQDPARIEVCRTELDACVSAAQIPADIDVCSEREARCIAAEMQVEVPEGVPLEVLVQCTATATECALTALNPDSLYGCTLALSQCIDGVIVDSLSCLERFDQCVAADPLLLPICSLELLVCRE